MNNYREVSLEKYSEIYSAKKHKKRNTPSLTKQIYLNSNKKCSICGIDLHIDTSKFDDGKYCCVDHIIPKSRGGSSQIENLRPICRKCNSARGNKVGRILIDNIINAINKSDLTPRKLFIEDDIRNGFVQMNDVESILFAIESVYTKNKQLLEYLRFSK